MRGLTLAAILTTRMLNIAWKYLYTAKDTWLGPKQNLGVDRLALLLSPWIRSRNTT